MTFDELTQHHLRQLREHDQPFALAAAYVCAVSRYLDDCLGDEPGDNHPRDVPGLIKNRRQATSLGRSLYAMTEEGKR